ncbi:Hsp20/alpha crystallin family protein [Aeromicrobium marinum DSM 15272]|uniref:Hsp20/alpha crystallin family protein n=1 Tax=Aeromicrobium marinum DSM 15272 TaxID=585531 RepID=E2SBJ0_9ACTN|nr:Hsp20/alpha crystallin family protein [Aeromicrobium marinum]EFQ83736.1 Hsp20/alpha crystallin family protein [Aeromicrobium marinum DSM 15272]
MSTLSVRSRRDPLFAEFDALVRSTIAPAARERLDFTPAAESVRDGDDVVLRMDLPGIDPGEVSVEVVTGRLVVSGERVDQRADGDATSTISEVRYGAFKRSFGLPSHLGPDAVSAAYDRGVLSIRVAGVYAGTEPTRITVADGAGSTE